MKLRKASSALMLGLVILASGVTLMSARSQAAEGVPAKKLAFLVGINNYRHAKLDPLQFAERDVEELASLLKKQGYSVVLLTPASGKRSENLLPTRRNIDARLQELLQDVTRDDQIVVGLAGHGIQPDGAADSYFCPLDGNPSVESGQGAEPAKVLFPGTLLAITGKQGLLRSLDNSGIGRKLLLIDACRNDPESGRGRGVGSTITELPEKTWLLLSCSARQRAWETGKLGGGHGVFFHFVLEGMKGGAADKRGRVTWQQLSQYVTEQVELEVPRVIGDGATQLPDMKQSGSGVPVLAILPTGTFPAEAGIGTTSASEGEAEITNSFQMRLRRIPPGRFLMGSPESEKERKGDEQQHEVQISKAFYLGKFEVTQAEFERIMLRNPSGFSATGNSKDKVVGKYTAQHPVERVSWFDAIEFCNKASEKEHLSPYYRMTRVERNGEGSIKEADVTVIGGGGYRLPTEAEWEYSCRAGTTTPFHFGSVSNGRESNVDGSSPYQTTSGPYLQRTQPVGSYDPNQFGLYDMHGNVREWCGEWYDEKYYSRSPATDPPGASTGSHRTRRGGSWITNPVNTRSAARDKDTPATQGEFYGFRVAVGTPVKSR